MDWTKIRRKKVGADKPPGVYANLDDLIRILNFEEIRRYLPGDDIRTMDWKVTARTRSPHVRVYTEEKDRAILLVVDQRINMFFGTRDKLKSVTAAELAALGAWRAVAVGDRIGAVIFNDAELFDIQPQRSQKTVMSILGNVVQMNHALRADTQVEPNAGMLNRALEKALQLVPHDGLIVMISDFFGVDEQTERLAARMAEHNDVLALLVHDPIRLQPAEKRVTVSDGSLQMEIDFADKHVREKLAENYREEQEHITRFLNRLAAPLLMVSNQGDVVDQVRRLLGVSGRAR